MAERDLVEEIKSYKEEGHWRYSLIRWLAVDATPISPVLDDRVYHYISSLNPALTREEIQQQIEILKTSGLVEEKPKELGGCYLWMPDEWRNKLRDVLEIPVVPPPVVAPAIVAPRPAYEELLVGGPIEELFKGSGLEKLVVMLLQKKGYAHVSGPKVPYKRTHFDTWALDSQGTLLLVECKGWGEPVGIDQVRDFDSRYWEVRRDEPTRDVEAWFVTVGDLTSEAEGLCQERGFKIITGMQLLKQVVAYGILGVGIRENQPYVTRPGEQGIFLKAEQLQAQLGDPTLALEITS